MPHVRLRLLEQSPHFRFIPQEDRFLLRPQQPILRLGLIGAGTMGLEHLRISSLEERGAISAIYDPHHQILKNAIEYANEYLGYQPTGYDSLNLFLENQSLDGYIISTPNHTHLDIFKALLKTEKPVYIEKPMAHTLENSIELYHLAAQYPAPVHIGLQYRYKPQYITLFQEMSAGHIGQVHQVQIIEHRPPFLDKVSQWNKYNEYSGGTLIEKCCHYFNLMHMITQCNPISISCITQQAHNFRQFNTEKPASAIDSAQVIMTFSDAITANLSLCMFSPTFYEEAIVCGDHGRIKAVEESDVINPEFNQCFVRLAAHETGCSKMITPKHGQLITASGHNGATFHAQKLFVDAILSHGTTQPTSNLPPPADLKESLWSILMAHAAQLSAETGFTIAFGDLINEYKLDFLQQ